MPEIKTRETRTDIKVIDRSAIAGARMKNAFVRAKDKVVDAADDQQMTPNEYAEEQVFSAVRDISDEVDHLANRGVRSAVNRKECSRTGSEAKTQRGRRSATSSAAGGQTSIGTERTMQTMADHSGLDGQNYQKIKKPVRAIRQTAKSDGKATIKTAKGTVKTAGRGVKTAQQTSGAAIKTAQVSAKTAQRTARATAKAARASTAAIKAAARTAAAAAKAVAKAAATAAKAVAAGAKTVLAAFAAGGWVAVLVVVIICLVALIVGSAYGIFFAGEDTGNGQTIQEVMKEIDRDFENRLEQIKQANPHDVVEVSGSRADWREVLAVYAVKTTSDPEYGQEVVTLNDEKKHLLAEVFWDVNEVTYYLEEKQVPEIVEIDDGEGNVVETEVLATKNVLCILITHKSINEMEEEYQFTDEQQKLLLEIVGARNSSRAGCQ